MKSIQRPGPARHAVARKFPQREIAIVSVGLLALTTYTPAQAATQVIDKNPGGIVAVGPVHTDYGFPSWYEDSTGTRLELCLDGQNPLCGFPAGEIPDESAPISFPDNFPAEAFYMLASSALDLPGGGSADLVLGLEAAFANTVQPGDQVVFGRQRVVVKGATPNTTYTFKHPYGTVSVDTDASGRGRLVEDISPAIGNFTTALKSNIGPFLRWDPAQAPAAPDGYLGNPDAEHTVTGSPFGYNRFSASLDGVEVSTDLFGLQGKISTDDIEPPLDPNDVTAPAVTGQLPAAGATGIRVADNITATFSETVAGFNGANVRLTDPAGTVVASSISYDAATKTATLDPAENLANNTVYTLSLTNGIQDASANALAATSWSFTTDEASAITDRTPTGDAADVPLAANVTVTFSEPVTGFNDTTMRLTDPSGATVDSVIGYDEATRTATLDPVAELAAGTRYSVSLTDGINDASASALAATTWSFTTDAPPTATGWAPAGDAVDVRVGENITATFSEPVTGADATSVTLAAASGTAVPATVNYDEATRTATLDPTSNLANNTRYTVSLSDGITDATGNKLAAGSWSFTTDALMTVTGRTPAVNATNVRVGENITATFSEAATGTSGANVRLTNASGATVPAVVSYNEATRTATLNPTSNLANNTRYTVTLSGGVTDATGNTLATTSWSFTTDALMTITGRTPAANATNVRVGENITARFSEVPTGANGANMWLTNPAGAKVPATVSYNASTRTATLNPTANLAAGTRYTVKLSNGITDPTGNKLATTSWNFTTDKAPTVTSATPKSRATNVDRDGNIKVRFSEAVKGINGSSVKLVNSSGAKVSATVSYKSGTRTATLNPKSRLKANTRYTVKLSGGITDSGSNKLAAKSWNFRTGAR